MVKNCWTLLLVATIMCSHSHDRYVIELILYVVMCLQIPKNKWLLQDKSKIKTYQSYNVTDKLGSFLQLNCALLTDMFSMDYV